MIRCPSLPTTAPRCSVLLFFGARLPGDKRSAPVSATPFGNCRGCRCEVLILTGAKVFHRNTLCKFLRKKIFLRLRLAFCTLSRPVCTLGVVLLCCLLPSFPSCRVPPDFFLVCASALGVCVRALPTITISRARRTCSPQDTKKHPL